MAERVVVLSIPQLRRRDVTPGALASLEALAGRGGMADFQPPFPNLAAPAFATVMTGVGPHVHGIVGDAFFDRQSGSVVKRPFPDALVQGHKLWDLLHASRPTARTLCWFVPNGREGKVDAAAWVDAAGNLSTNPGELAAELESRFGPYRAPRVHPTGEPLRLAATAWMLKTAASVLAETKPDLAILRIPYLGQVARRFGPDGPEACRSVVELEGVLKPFLGSIPPETRIVAFTESVSTPVIDPVYPNLVLRGLGLLRLIDAPDGGTDIDPRTSAAFALADHQLCQIYLNDPDAAAPIAAAFSGAHDDGIATIATGNRRVRLGLAHDRSGEVILIAHPDRWFAPDWWASRREIPRRPDSGSGLALGSEIDPSHIRASLGAPPPNDDYLGVVVASHSDLLRETSDGLMPRDLTSLLHRALGIDVLR